MSRGFDYPRRVGFGLGAVLSCSADEVTLTSAADPFNYGDTYGPYGRRNYGAFDYGYYPYGTDYGTPISSLGLDETVVKGTVMQVWARWALRPWASPSIGLVHKT